MARRVLFLLWKYQGMKLLLVIGQATEARHVQATATALKLCPNITPPLSNLLNSNVRPNLLSHQTALFDVDLPLSEEAGACSFTLNALLCKKKQNKHKHPVRH